MRCLDSTFLIDLLRAEPSAVNRAREIDQENDQVATPALCVAELLRGALLGNRRELHRTEELLSQVEVLPLDFDTAREAAQIAADCQKRGRDVPLLDCTIAATARRHKARLVTRDVDFARVPGLLVETY